MLLAEDQEMVRRHIARMLGRIGFDVVHAQDGVEAVAAVESSEEEFSLVMLDLQMPRRGGDEAARMIRALDEGVPIVMVSGNTDDARIGRLQATTEVTVLAKPFDLDALSLAVAQAR